jgi:Zn-dependent peptidase ImmA (M78 family)/formiminotetrahydrofolate cyclodeaminase
MDNKSAKNNWKPLLEYSTKELLEKFGKGGHKPGSGSAAALQGLLSVKLLHTVISLTKNSKNKSDYQSVLPELLMRDKDLTEIIYPRLEDLFQEDSILFDKVIEFRLKRDSESNRHRKIKFNDQALEALKPATEIVIEIGDLCGTIADDAAFVFDNAFRPAKGDSGVAMSGAVAALGGCLAIIDLNLSSFGSNDWTLKTRDRVEILRKDYNSLLNGSRQRMDEFTVTSQKKSFERATKNLSSGKWEEINLSNKSIEELATQAGSLLWEFRDQIWEKDTPTLHYEVLRPEVVIEQILGYKFSYDSLGYYEDNGDVFQVAGLINKNDKTVVISKELTPEVRNFTIAHELGHALMHSGLSVLHRDRVIDGSNSTSNDIKERQANKFAASFLMPSQVVKLVFQQIFQADRFVVNKNNVFNVGGGRLEDFIKRHRNTRGVARFLAKYEGGKFKSLSNIFGVSTETMAIRLEELGLIEFY